MNIKFIKDRDVLSEIKNALPSTTILWTPSVVLIKHPNKDVCFVLKNRYRDKELLELPDSSFEVFNELRVWNADNYDLERKHLIFDETMLNNRGKEILRSL